MQKKKDTRQSGIAKNRSKGKNDTMFSFPERSIFGRAFGELDGCAENGTNEDRTLEHQLRASSMDLFPAVCPCDYCSVPLRMCGRNIM
jgi:hypothetical protein